MLTRRLLVLPALAAVLAAAACGGGGGVAAPPSTTQSDITVPAGDVAIVAGTGIPKSDYDQLFTQYQAAYKAQKKAFPSPGTADYEALKQQTLNVLIQRVELAKEAAARGISVTDAEVQTQLDSLKQQFYGGDEQKYQAELKTYGATDQSVRATIKAQLIARKLYDQITKNVTVTDQQVETYYNDNKSQFKTGDKPEERHVAHILVKTKQQAEKIYTQLKGGADFATLAKQYSTDASSAKNGGDLGTAPRSQWVKPFGDAAWALKTGQISEPVHSQFGWHIIKAVGPIEPAVQGHLQPLAVLRETIKTQLLAKAKDQKMTDWVSQIQAKYTGQIGYAGGFQPVSTTPTTPAPGDTTIQGTTSQTSTPQGGTTSTGG